VRFLVVSLIGGILAVALFNLLAYKKIDALLFSMRIPAVNPGNVLFKEAVYANGLALVLTIFIYILAAKEIHAKIAGSLHRIRADIRRITRGDLGTRILLTEDEEFTDFADDLNLMAGELRRRFSELKDRFERIDDLVRELGGVPDGDAKILEERIMPLIAAVEDRLNEFKR
jgi:methyl-accepting chemotaxis protein